MISVRNYGNLTWAMGAFFCASFLGLILFFGIKLGFAIALVPLTILIILPTHRAILFLILVLLSFHASPLLSQNLLDITGLKPFNIICLIAIGILILSGRLMGASDPLEKKSQIFFFIYFLIFTVVFFHSLNNLSVYHALNPLQFPKSEFGYILSFYVTPSLYLVSFIFILKEINTGDRINLTVSVIAISTFFLSCVVVLIGILHWGELAQGRGVMRELMQTYLGMHYNSVGAIYIVCGPILLYKALSKHPFWMGNYLLSAIAILFLQSRSSLLVFVFTSVLLLVLLRKRTLFIIMATIAGLLVFFWLPDFINQGLSTGLAEGSLDAMLSGRVNYLWLPLLDEWSRDPFKLLFGAGRYGLMTSSLWGQAFIVQAGHAHNAYIDFFLDSGIILFCIFMIFLFKYLVAAWRHGQQINTPLYWSLFVSIIGFLIGGFSGRSFYPTLDNMYLFPVIALLINVVRQYRYRSGMPDAVSSRLAAAPYAPSRSS